MPAMVLFRERLKLTARLMVARGWAVTSSVTAASAAGHNGAANNLPLSVAYQASPLLFCGVTPELSSARRVNGFSRRRQRTESAQIVAWSTRRVSIPSSTLWRFESGRSRHDFLNCEWSVARSLTRASSTAITGEGDVSAVHVSPAKDNDGGDRDKLNPGEGSRESKPKGSGEGKPLRLSKLLTDRAVGSRTEVDVLIRRGRIKVEGSVVRSPKTKFPVDSAIEVNGEPCEPIPLLVAFHKPKGVITTLKDDWDREDLTSVLPKVLLRKHHPVGRLDGDSSGLLLLSSDGALTHKLLSPKYNVEREYVATVDVPEAGDEPGDTLIKALSDGVPTADGTYAADVPSIHGRDVRVVVREGKNRMVRRMLANAGFPVLELRRERYGNILLGDIAEGEHAPVSGDALEWAQSMLAAGVEADS